MSFGLDDMRLSALEVIDRMKAVLNVSTDTELAVALNVSKQTVSSWKRRQAVPQKIIVYVATKTMSDIEFFIKKSYRQRNYAPTVGLESLGVPVALCLYSIAKDYIKFGNEISTLLWWGDLFPNIVEYYDREIHTALCEVDQDDVPFDLIGPMIEALQQMSPTEIAKLVEDHFAEKLARSKS